ncbi:RloG protein, partial [Campylobacter coli]|nr:RloG protein [Campylobacter coli]EFP6175646.1 RloG protein [Campylobacter coli]EGL6276874.1 RloG protein [Campylobacter coli]
MTEEKENIVNFKIKIIHEENIELGIMANSLL